MNDTSKISMIIGLFIVVCSVVNAEDGESSENTINKRPNIIFILADDLGWNDVSFHGSSQIFTPNIDALGYSGIILNRYYVTPICTPSRSSLMTGKYPIHTGMQHAVLYGAEPRGLPLKEKLLPEYLKKLGYSNHIVGKWHLGSYKLEYTPLYRGFDSHIGFWTGHQDYFDHQAEESGQIGLDMRRGIEVADDLYGRYVTDLITEEAVKVIDNHVNKTDPLFLYVAHAATHSGNSYDPLPAPEETVKKFSNIVDMNRRKFAAMTYHLDESVGAIVAALAKTNQLENSIIIFSTDNGGPAAGFNLNAASNFPLRGVKNTLWEGGVRGAGLIWSPLLNKTKRVSNQIFHITDWLPTLLAAAGYDEKLYGIDGINHWEELSSGEPTKRYNILHNIDDIWGSASVTMGKFKILKGTNYNGTWDSWYGPEGDRNESDYNSYDLFKSKTAQALKGIHKMPSIDKILKLRRKATITCGEKKEVPCNPLEKSCVYNVHKDPCELEDISDANPELTRILLKVLREYNSTAVPPGNLPLDPCGFPKFWDYTWTNFGDFMNSSREDCYKEFPAF